LDIPSSKRAEEVFSTQRRKERKGKRFVAWGTNKIHVTWNANYRTFSQQEERTMGLGRIAEAGVITWFLGGGFLMFIIVLLLLKAC